MALLAVSPMLANAQAIPTANTYDEPAHTDNTNVASNNPQYALVGIDDSEQGHIASTAYVKGAYNSTIRAINKVAQTADSAVKSVAEGSTNGTVSVNGTDVAVHGLGSAAYTDSTDYDGAGAAAAVETKLTTGGGASGYDINAKTLKVQGVNVATVSGEQTLTNKTIDADNNTIQDLTLGNLKEGLVSDEVRTLTQNDAGYTDWSTNKTIATEKAVSQAISGAVSGMVTESSTNTFTNKTINAEGTGNSITNLKTTNIKEDTLITSGEDFTDSNDTKLPTVKAVNTVLSDYAKKTGVTQTISNSTGTATAYLYKKWGDDNEGTGRQAVTFSVSLAGAAYAEPQ